MSTTLKLLSRLGIDTSEYDAGMQKAGEKAGSFDKMLRGLSIAGGGMLATAGASVMAFGGFMATTIGPASDLNETITKNEVVFGKAADQILAWGENSATALGMSQQAALSATGTFGNLFRTVGLDADASADMSMSLVGLAADLASFNNMDPTEVLTKLQSGLVGETMPLRSLGINLNEAGIRARAVEMGLASMTGEMSSAARTQAAYALIMEQSALAQGDFARTSGGLANQQRILAAQVANLKAKLGTALLPVLTKLMDIVTKGLADKRVAQALDGLAYFIERVSTRLLDYLPRVAEWMQKSFNWIVDHESVVVAALAVVGASVAAFVYTVLIPAAIAAIGALLPILIPMALIGAAVYLLREAWVNDWGGIQEKTALVWGAIEPKLTAIVNWLKVKIPAALETLRKLWDTKWSGIFSSLKEKVAGVSFQSILDGLQTVKGKFAGISTPEFDTGSLTLTNKLQLIGFAFTGASILVSLFGAAIGAAATTIMTTILPVIAVIALIAGAVFLLYEAWVNNWGGIRDTLTGVWASIQPVLATLWEWLSTNIGKAIEALSTLWTGTLLPAIQAVWKWLSEVLFPFFASIENLLSAVVGKALETLAALWETVLLPAIKTVWQFLYDTFNPILTTLADLFKITLGPAIQWIIDNVFNLLKEDFENISRLIQDATGFFNTLAEGIRGFDPGKAIKDFGDWLGTLSLPDWLTPGSPTPLEIGLRGIQRTMQNLSATTLPEFQARMSFAGEGAGAGGSTQITHANYFGAVNNYSGESADQASRSYLSLTKRP